MPQMAPLLWLNLFIFFCISLLIFFVMNYFLPPNSKTKPAFKSSKMSSLNWKW
uniref:ATP synthase complex subunit 8 n=1 Tax=Typhlatya consobrina TaxID=1173213 RepID=A0A1Z2R7F7_9EUCA|nr:ATP synthase F0 subunit 8 [Typhlatya consobrina]ASA39544.1 ATP synthase F0 subunit 8 [Typhlatya consobrina]